MLPLFGRNSISFDIYTQFYLTASPSQAHRLDLWNFYILQPPYLQRYADAGAGKGAPLYNCFEFVD